MELLQIERELAGPEAADHLARYDAQLVALNGRLEAALAEGLPPEDFAKCAGLGDVVTIARKLLRIQMRGKKL